MIRTNFYKPASICRRMPMIGPAQRTANITYAIRDVALKAKELEKKDHTILSLNIGDPMKFDFAVPEHMVKAMMDSIRKGIGQAYADSHGVEEACAAIAKEMQKTHTSIGKDDVVMTNGSSEGINLAIGALLNPGENILIPCPSYPVYNASITYHEGIINTYLLDEEDGFQPHLEDMKQKVNDKTRAVVLIDPNNPTGALCSKKTVKEFVNFAGQHNLAIMADEAYSKILFDGKEHYPAASLAGDVPVLTLGSLSKNYLCPGWRVGWIAFSGKGLEEYKKAVLQLARARLCAVTPQQYAVKTALEGNQAHIAAMNKKLEKRRDITFRRLNEIKNLSCVKPGGAFYAFPQIHSSTFATDKDFVYQFLEEEKVLTVFGSGFGQKQGTKHFRIVFLPDEKTLNEAYDRLEQFMLRHS